MLRLHDHHVAPSLLAKFNKQRGNTSLTRVRPQRDNWKSILTRIEEAFDDCIKGFLTQMCARFSPSRSAAPWEEGADALVPANQR